ncbi:MAG: TIM barrel protein [Kiritimatiellae bacterium]|nr:TIM barrel protein [Kiritimatiellia bacterium]
MHIGMKLLAGYAEREDAASLFQDVDNPFAAIRDLGMTFVETGILHHWDADLYRRTAREATNHGLRLNLHPYLREERALNRFAAHGENVPRAALEWALELAAEVSAIQGAPCMVVFHAPSFNERRLAPHERTPREAFIPRVQAIFLWIQDRIRTQRYDIRVSSEHQLPAGAREANLIGETYDELIRTVEGTEFGLCWDTGHSFIGTQKLGIPLYPPRAYLEKVAHVHLHDVTDGRDHQPIIFDGVPVEQHLRLLKEAGFDGDINLELSARRVVEAGGFREIMPRCVERVRRAWHAP